MYHERILRMAMVINDRPLWKSLIFSLTEKLMDGTLAPTEILVIADRLQIRTLQGVAYYAQLMQLQKNNSDVDLFPANFPLEKDQRIRLLTGYWSLMKRWEHLQDNPISIEQSPSCPAHIHTTNCRPNWDRQWRTYARDPLVTQHPSADILWKIQTMRKLLQANSPWQNIPNLQTQSSFPQNLSSRIQVLQQHHSALALNSHPPPHNTGLINPQQYNLPVINNLQQQNIPVTNNLQQQNPNNLHMLPLQSQRNQANALAMQAVLQSSSLCINTALAAMKKLSHDILVSLPDIFSEDALGLTQRSP
jgi:hypothetical protein